MIIMKNYSLSDLQIRIDEFISIHGGYWSPLSMLSAIMEELGEVAREINHLEGYKPKKGKKETSKVAEELADLLFAIICLANNYNIDLNEELEKIIRKYSTRDRDRFI